ncbi:hypothetical protein P7K49_037945 [Saguinus oedipus]|uniref:Uncharacterized protein n=1 Tax=Saguinus oedipus TaxID=9490 RepID=A0ABQ9TD85_SAGOE|nr:hypothetical protein P7K49_037945 [Saguinus oedipus]
MLLDEENREARVALLQPLNMLVQTVGGRERSPGEYQRLLEQHGFCQVQMARFGGILDAILATRAVDTGLSYASSQSDGRYDGAHVCQAGSQSFALLPASSPLPHDFQSISCMGHCPIAAAHP